MNPSHKEVEWNLDLRRRLGIDEVAEWNELQEELELIVFSEEDDTVIWALEPSGKFSTKSLYRFMKHSGNVDLRMTELWKVNLPLKIKIFLCLSFLNFVVANAKL